jgi:hypothetical protein
MPLGDHLEGRKDYKGYRCQRRSRPFSLKERCLLSVLCELLVQQSYLES